MDLMELMDSTIESSALYVSAEGERLVTLRLADDYDVGLRLHQRDSYRTWNVLEIAVRSRGSHESLSVDDLHDLPMAALIREARRLAIKSATPETV